MNYCLNTCSILKIPREAIVALVNEVDKKAYVFVSLNAPIRLIQLVQTTKFIQDDLDKLSIRILETHNDLNVLKILSNIHQIKLIKEGYSLYKFNKYKQIYPVVEASYDFEGNPIVLANYATNSRTKELIGVFKTFEEANEFIESLKAPYTLVTAYNVETKKYIEQRDEQLDYIFNIRF